MIKIVILHRQSGGKTRWDQVFDGFIWGKQFHFSTQNGVNNSTYFLPESVEE